MTERLHNKVALITGGSNGIGAATAKLFAKEGAKVIIGDIDRVRGQALVQEIQNKNGQALFIHLDVSDEDAWKKTTSEIVGTYHLLNILVNNAGISVAKSVQDMSLKEWRNTMAINLDSVFMGTKYAIPIMEKCGGGRIINISSASGIVGSPMASAYCASKGAIRLFTKSIALECAKANNNILVNSVHPGGVDTSIWEKSDWWEDFVKEKGSHEAALQAISQGSPLGRMATSDEIAKGILFLASDDSSYMTGCELVIDGGYTAQ